MPGRSRHTRAPSAACLSPLAPSGESPGSGLWFTVRASAHRGNTICCGPRGRQLNGDCKGEGGRSRQAPGRFDRLTCAFSPLARLASRPSSVPPGWPHRHCFPPGRGPGPAIALRQIPKHRAHTLSKRARASPPRAAKSCKDAHPERALRGWRALEVPVTAEPTEYRRETLTEEETGPQKGLRDLLEVTQLGSCRTGRVSNSRVSPSLCLFSPGHSTPVRPDRP